MAGQKGQAAIESLSATARRMSCGQVAIELAASAARHLHWQAAIESLSATAGSLARGQAAIESACADCWPPSKKGQAAMESLVTYGWALLALFAVLALLFSTGAISTGNFSVAG